MLQNKADTHPKKTDRALNMSPNVRYLWLDGVRAVAVVLMIIFHFFYDLSYFGWYKADVSGVSAWLPLRYFIISLFTLSLGLSLSLVHAKKYQWKKYGLWFAKVFLAAILVSVGTSFIFPNNWVYFGILHFMCVVSVLVLLLVRFKWLSFFVGVSIIAVYIFADLTYGWPINHVQFLFHENISEDFVPLFPWAGVALIGSALTPLLVKSTFLNKLGAALPKAFLFLGRNTLIIYLIHQPIIFGLLFGIKLLFL